jgi:hypothetical protein
MSYQEWDEEIGRPPDPVNFVIVVMGLILLLVILQFASQR